MTSRTGSWRSPAQAWSTAPWPGPGRPERRVAPTCLEVGRVGFAEESCGCPYPAAFRRRIGHPCGINEVLCRPFPAGIRRAHHAGRAAVHRHQHLRLRGSPDRAPAPVLTPVGPPGSSSKNSTMDLVRYRGCCRPARPTRPASARRGRSRSRPSPLAFLVVAVPEGGDVGVPGRSCCRRSRRGSADGAPDWLLRATSQNGRYTHGRCAAGPCARAS